MVEFKELSGGRGRVSKDGRFFGASGRELKGYVRHGYVVVQAGPRQEKLHRLVAEAFIENPSMKPEINHIDGNKINNRADNLEWASHTENMRHAVQTGLHRLPHGEKARAAKLSQSDVNFIRANYKPRSQDANLKRLGEKFGVTEQCIHRIVKGVTWPEARP